ncbi:hypothetical protein FCULG_00006381 [Fusarium culmorum]|uniref:Amidohydrolase-related domain-containing protein n=1 Tax=Fusarium culmorum TaxID=5516 RepID=A0A2T4GTQ1_FUSCU|nr:hypothetical protein FCULG_00006381 [Fusarium culmorum]
MSNQILLQNGTVLQHDEKDNLLVLRNTDVLFSDGRIAEINQDINKPEHASVIDFSSRTSWDCTMLDYMLEANLQSFNFTSKDIFWGQLAGCLEALDSGTTCVVDNAHTASQPEHGSAALSATIASGIRSVFCYGVMPLSAKVWTESSFELDRSLQPEWLLPQIDTLAAKAPFGDDQRVQLGFFFDSYFLPGNVISETMNHPISKGQSKVPEQLSACGLLGPDILLTHGNGTTPEQASLLTSSGTYIVSTPDAEILMASGADPLAFREDLPLTCLGADCHSCGPVNMMHQIKPRASIQAAFNLATIKAARAINMDKDIGSIAVGKLADLVIFDTSSPSLGCTAENDLLTAIVRQADVREVETVIVGGKVRKRDGVLQDVYLDEGSREGGFDLQQEAAVAGNRYSWKEVAEKLSLSRRDIQERIGKTNRDLAKSKLLGMLGGLDGILFY